MVVGMQRSVKKRENCFLNPVFTSLTINYEPYIFYFFSMAAYSASRITIEDFVGAVVEAPIPAARIMVI